MSTVNQAAFTGTIAAGGTLSQIINTEGYSVHGLLAIALTSTLTLGTLTPLVSHDGVTFCTLQEAAVGVLGNVAWMHGTGNYAVSWKDMQCLRPYQYVRFIDSVAQVNGCRLVIAAKEG